jgi:hypothetical protein
MIQEFSIRHLKSKEIADVILLVNKYTQGDISEFIHKAFNKKDLDSYITCLDATNYLCFKTIIFQQTYIEMLRKQIDAGKQ